MTVMSEIMKITMTESMIMMIELICLITIVKMYVDEAHYES